MHVEIILNFNPFIRICNKAFNKKQKRTPFPVSFVVAGKGLDLLKAFKTTLHSCS
jgi:hypothetical protein